MFDGIKCLLRAKYDNTDDYDERYLKIRFILNDNLFIVSTGVNASSINKPTSYYGLSHHF